MRHNRRFLAPAGLATAGAGLLLALSVPLLAGPAAAASVSPGCEPAAAVTAYHFTINGKTASSLHGMVHQGDQVEAFFTIAEGCRNVSLALVSHTSPDPYFVRSHVSQQRVFDAVRGTFSAGSHTLGPVRVPDCNFQVDFEALATKSAPGFTYSSATGGTTKCSTGGTTTTTEPPTTVAPTTTTAAVLPTSVSVPPTTARVLATQTPAGTLPLTGSDSGLLVGIASALLVCGGAMIALANRSTGRSLHSATSTPR